MAWSTRQLADLTGVTLRSIRHWHEVGLIPEPERLSNGYKQYTARHLVLALRIARLTSLGFTLEHVAAMLDSEDQGQESLLGLRAELDSRITELTRIRSDLDELVARGISPDLSPEALLALEALGPGPGSRNVAILLARLLPKEDMPGFAEAMQRTPDALHRLNADLLNLPAETTEAEIRALAEQGAALITAFLTERGDALPRFDARVGEQIGAEAMTALVNEQMNPAQRRVMMLIIERLTQQDQRP
ncbi:MerR family transcriptional regulator [Leucobacter celer]|uniref:MerR family transcriptional regulator n=1 Tax=Leucobacter celer TaxID=668625 RepID=UPI0006A7777C|nr:MerR family transcriptional regulator [Leucobacter celer]